MKNYETTSSLAHLLQEERKFYPSIEMSKNAHIKSMEEYQNLYNRSIAETDSFWLEQSKTLHWFNLPTKSCNFQWNYDQKIIRHTWFEDGKINVSYNCLDRHLENARHDKVAIIWQGDDEKELRYVTYSELHKEVCQFANVLKKQGIKKGDRVCIYMPMVPESAVAMLACARIGAIHSIIFAGFSSEALIHRIQDASCRLVITSNVSIRGGKHIPLKEIVDQALLHTSSVEKVIVLKRTSDVCPMNYPRDSWYHEEIKTASMHCPPEVLDAEDPLFILYTSGSTGKPKGVVHTQAGYLLHAALSHKYIFDIHDNDIYWCTADIGWITGHSYVIYGPLANGSTSLMFEGTPFYPDPGRFWQIVETFKVSILYTAPTVIRSLIASGTSWPKKYNLHSLRILGSVGEPINPEAWMWYYEVIGHGSLPIVDTWWQTETGGIMISPLPGSHCLKPGSATRPFFGVEPIVLNEDGTPCDKNEGGALCIKRPWPGMMRTTWGDHSRFVETYFKKFKNYYFTGDGCRIDPEGDFWLLGRMDDIVNVSGHRIGTAEVESALVSHEAVSEAAVVPMPHEIKGQGLCAYVTLVNDVLPSSKLKQDLATHVRNQIGAIAIPDKIQFAQSLPKTRSGKIMRRLLKKIAERSLYDLGDISTLADPGALEDLMREEE